MRMTSFWQRLQAAIGLLAGLIAIAQAVEPVRRALGVLYPVGVITVLAVTAVALSLNSLRFERRLARSLRQATAQATREADIRLALRLRERFPAELMYWVREWDFGNSWREDQQAPFFRYAHVSTEQDEQFLDTELDQLRQGFAKALVTFVDCMVQHAGPSKFGQDLYNVLDKDDRDASEEGHRIWSERRDSLNDAAVPVAESWEALLAGMRKKYPESIP
jgi:hypothetical protein